MSHDDDALLEEEIFHQKHSKSSVLSPPNNSKKSNQLSVKTSPGNNCRSPVLTLDRSATIQERPRSPPLTSSKGTKDPIPPLQPIETPHLGHDISLSVLDLESNDKNHHHNADSSSLVYIPSSLQPLVVTVPRQRDITGSSSITFEESMRDISNSSRRNTPGLRVAFHDKVGTDDTDDNDDNYYPGDSNEDYEENHKLQNITKILPSKSDSSLTASSRGPGRNGASSFSKTGSSSSLRHSSSNLSRKLSKREKKERDKARRYKRGAMSGETEFGHLEYESSAKIDDDTINNDDDFFNSDEDNDVGYDFDCNDTQISSTDGTFLEDGSKGEVHPPDPETTLVIKQQLERASSNSFNTKKKKLILRDLNLTNKQLPLSAICTKPLGPELYKLNLSGNRLVALPKCLVSSELKGLRTLDLSQCKLTSLPTMTVWNLPYLRRFILSHNRLEEFLDETALKGLPSLEQLDIDDNRIYSFDIPEGNFLTKLEHLNLNYNDLSNLPDDLPRLVSLRTLKVANNLLPIIPEDVCAMSLRELSVTPNPLIQPPLEDCEQGIDSMRRYYNGLNSYQKPKVSKKRRANKKKSRRRSKRHTQDNDEQEGQEPSSSPLQEDPAVVVSDNPDELISSPSSQVTLPYVNEANLNSVDAHYQRYKDACEDQPNSRIDQSSPSVVSQPPSSQVVTVLEEKEKVDASVDDRVCNDNKNINSVNDIKESNEGSAETITTKATQITNAHEGVTPQLKQLSLEPTNNKSPAGDHVLNESSDANDVPSASTNLVAPILVDPSVPPAPDEDIHDQHKNTVNDTLKVIFVGCAYAGKTSIIKRLKDGASAKLPKTQERTVGVNIYNWVPNEPSAASGIDTSGFDTRLVQESDDESPPSKDDRDDIRFSVWDFAGQNEYLATHEIFFSNRALYVLVWDMAARNEAVRRGKKASDEDEGDFPLYVCSDDEDEDDEGDYLADKEERQAERALERDIDEKVQFWVNNIQSCIPGAVILPVATHDDHFDGSDNGGHEEAVRRCKKMKNRLLHHEKRRVEGLKKRLRLLKAGHQANSEAASRLRDLLSTFNRPKLIFGEDDDCGGILRVSGKENRGFDKLRAKIIHLATGRELPNSTSYPLFRGHVGSPIPRIRLQVREFVRSTRDKYQVVEWRHFLSMLQDYVGAKNMPSVGHISDALRFLSHIGEVSYFGSCKTISDKRQSDKSKPNDHAEDPASDNPIDEGTRTDNQTMGGLLEQDLVRDHVFGFSHFIFLNPRWLAAAVGCIVRHDLTQEIETCRNKTKNKNESTCYQLIGRGGSSFHSANKNCPVITAGDAHMLWRETKIIGKAAERAVKGSKKNMAQVMSPLEFLQQLLVHFRVIVPIDLNVDSAMLGGQEYSTRAEGEKRFRDTSSSQFFFLPSLLESGEVPEDTWTYKCKEACKSCLCLSWLFPDGVPPGLMERVTASVLRDVHAANQEFSGAHYSQNGSDEFDSGSLNVGDCEKGSSLRFRRLLCWRSAIELVLTRVYYDDEDDDWRSNRVELWIHLVEQDSNFCVAGDNTLVGERRLIVGAEGLSGDGCKNIWKGGYELVTEVIERVIKGYSGLEFKKEHICSRCLATLDIRKAHNWNEKEVRDARGDGSGLICCGRGHKIDFREIDPSVKLGRITSNTNLTAPSGIPFTDLCGGVVLVALWDGERRCIDRVGSGFVINEKRGLIVTASHTLIDMKSGPLFGSLFYGKGNAEVVVGVVGNRGNQLNGSGPEAYFRYFADIVAKDVHNMDACVLRITKKMENYVLGDGGEIGMQKCRYMTAEDIAKENLQKLKVTGKCEYGEQVRILGYNQGGEGLTRCPRLNRGVEVVMGNVVRKHAPQDLLHPHEVPVNALKSRKEIVIGSCPTIGGHSGGPCVNQAGEVIGILSRSDQSEKQRCYLVPSGEFFQLVRKVRLQDIMDGGF